MNWITICRMNCVLHVQFVSIKIHLTDNASPIALHLLQLVCWLKTLYTLLYSHYRCQHSICFLIVSSKKNLILNLTVWLMNGDSIFVNPKLGIESEAKDPVIAISSFRQNSSCLNVLQKIFPARNVISHLLRLLIFYL